MQRISIYRMNFLIAVTLLAISTVKCDVDLDRLFHSGVPTAAPQTASVNNIDQQGASDIPLANGDIFDELDHETFMPYRNSRHDEFDWALTKVRKTNALPLSS